VEQSGMKEPFARRRFEALAMTITTMTIAMAMLMMMTRRQIKAILLSVTASPFVVPIHHLAAVMVEAMEKSVVPFIRAPSRVRLVVKKRCA
jgi:hypothetical protein